ncbi:MAG: alpha/beta hydrolase [Deltaproteobacteria bacterium]
MKFFTCHNPEEYLNYEIHGTGPRPVVMLHGFAANLRVWDDLAAFFSPNEYTLHILDLKGHGGSSKNSGAGYSAEHNARMLRAYFHDNGLQDIILIGHSFGGAIALMTALDTPTINLLILIGAPAFPQQLPIFMRILALPVIGPLLMQAVPVNMIARAGLIRAFCREERITDRLIERYAVGYRGKGVSLALAQTVRQIIPPDLEEITARYFQLSVPALLLWGEDDRVVPKWQGKKLQQELRRSRLVIIPDCGHNPHEEMPQVTFAIIQEFIVDNSEGT